MENEKPEVPPVAPVPEKEKGLLDNLFTLDGLPKVFQIVLGASSLFYVTGYLCWAIYAWQNNLGFLSAIREQYLIAGIFPMLLMILTGITINGYFALIRWINSTIKIASGRYKSLFYVFLWTQVLMILIIIFCSRESLLVIHYHVFFIAFFIVFFIWYILTFSLFLSLGIEAWPDIYIDYVMTIKYFKIERYVKFIGYLYFPGFVLALYFLLIAIYVTILFPKIPREFGGPEAVCVQVDVKRADISLKTFSILMPIGIHDTTVVVRTKPLYLIFDEGEFMLFRQRQSKYDSTNVLLKIKKEVIMGMYDCDEPKK